MVNGCRKTEVGRRKMDPLAWATLKTVAETEFFAKTRFLLTFSLLQFSYLKMNQFRTKTYSTAVVLIPPKGIWEPIQSMRRVHDRHFARWMPHITLIYPFVLQSEFVKVIPKLNKASAKAPSFHLTFRHFFHFRHRRSCTIFLIPEPEQPIIELRSVLTNAFPNYNDTSQYPGGFHPHLSVGQFKHKTVLPEQKRLQKKWNPIECDVTHISLIYRSPETNDRFVVARDFALSK